MLIKTARKKDVLHITLEQKVKGETYTKSYTCSFDEAEKDFKQWLRETTGVQEV